jgi:SAM-dependent methyltransferase
VGNEASKTVALWGDDIRSLLKGKGLDIGAGPDPVIPGVQTFDQAHGDANKIDEYLQDQFDFVFSSHCLEHMMNPWDALPRWWKLIKPGGHMVLVVPDEDLYEQGFWPSLFNDDHKHTFTLKEKSWSPVSICIPKLIRTLENTECISITEQSNGYDRALLDFSKGKTREQARRRMRLANKIAKVFKPLISNSDLFFAKLLKAPVDQTGVGALAQIQIVLRKI